MPDYRIRGRFVKSLRSLTATLLIQFVCIICGLNGGEIGTAVAGGEYRTITFDLKEGLNGVSLAVENAELKTAEDLINAIEHCDAVKYWDATQQKFVEHLAGSAENDFDLVVGFPYFVHVTTNTSWSQSGNTPETLLFNLVTTDQTDINVLALPFDRAHLTTAEALASDIPNCDTLWYWDAEKQGYVGHPVGTQINNFPVSPGYPYFYNITDATSGTPWPVFTVSLQASTTSGTVPLTVHFSIPGVYGGIPPYTYSWDFDGDGIEDDATENPSMLYSEAGQYDVTLTMTDSAGTEATDTVSITVQGSPAVTASANPASGSAPLEVSFSCSATDPDGSIVLYEWDFEGDGAYDWNSTTTCSTTHTYESNGTYVATIRVKDNDDMTGTDSVDIAVGVGPTVDASVDGETSGEAPFLVNFVVEASDPDGSISLYEWDFDGNGVYDWSSASTGNTSHSYTSPGVFNATARVTDNDGLMSTDAVLIMVSGPPQAIPRAFPVSGNAPMTVTFFPNGEDPDGSVVGFAWDFDGDGTYDWDSFYADNTTHTYTKEGVYQAVLRVTDDEGHTNTATVTINVSYHDPNPEGYPTAMVDAAPSNGGAPLRVLFRGGGTDVKEGVIRLHEWDFDGNGAYDEQSAPPQFLGVKMSVGNYSMPIFVDVDHDGDNDAFIGANSGEIFFYRNDGDTGSPVWVSTGALTDSEGGTIDVGNNSAPAFTDIDGDGDYDLFIGQYDGKLIFYRNDGDANAPVWTYVGEVADSGGTAIDVGWSSKPAFTDTDNDGDDDLFIGEYYGTLIFYRNDGDNSAPVWTHAGAVTASGGGTIDVGSGNAPAFIDIDGDGDYDLFIGEDWGKLIFYRNDGSASASDWVYVGDVIDSGGTTIDIGSSSKPAFVDIDGDGDEDLFIGEYDGRLVFYRNEGDSAAPGWLLVSPEYNHVGVGYNSIPALTDIDGDGDYDLFIGEYYGKLIFYRNEGDDGAPVWTYTGEVADSGGTTISVGYSSAPAFSDIDGDGDVDLFIGEYNGKLIFYRNDGNASAPVWTHVGEVADSGGTGIAIDYYNSIPALTDIDGDGDYDLFIGEYYGNILFYQNDGDASAPVWTSMGPLTFSEGTHIDVGYNAAPAFGDMDQDGDLDLVLGEYWGRLFFYRNDGNETSYSFNSVEGIAGPDGNPLTLAYNSAPALADMDHDGDLDLFIGEYYGQIFYYPTISHTYQTPGTYQAVLRVTDNDGLTATDSMEIQVYPGGYPTAMAAANPTNGDVPLYVSLTGQGQDPDGTISRYEWDFDGDGTYDWSDAGTGTTSHDYTVPGTHGAVLRVTDNDGHTATDSVTIQTTLGISTYRTTAFKAAAGEKGTITSTLTADAEAMTIAIYDQSGNLVRTLVIGESRSAGTYYDVWDGKDDSGNIVSPGLYYFTIQYTVNGQVYTYDLRVTSEYSEVDPSRTFSTIFAPYEDIFYELTYTLYKPAEVSVYFWTWGADGWAYVHVRKLFVREFRDAATHTEIWDGIDDNGAPVVGGKQYMPVIQVFNIADSAIMIVGDQLKITDVSVEPNYLTPVYNPYSTVPTQQTTVLFNLSKAATVEVSVFNSENVLVRAMNEANLPTGPNSILWDGKDTSGRLVTGGSYRISLTARDNEGNRSNSRTGWVFVYY